MAADPGTDVAIRNRVHQDEGGGGHSHESNTPGMLRGAMTLKRYLISAYNAEPFQVTGGPAWIDGSTSERQVHLSEEIRVARVAFLALQQWVSF